MLYSMVIWAGKVVYSTDGYIAPQSYNMIYITLNHRRALCRPARALLACLRIMFPHPGCPTGWQQCATFAQQYLLSVEPGTGLLVVLVHTLALPSRLPLALLGVVGAADDPQPGY